MKKFLLTFAFLSSLAGCRCDGGLNPGQSGFRVSPQSLEFGRVLEGHDAKQTLTLTGTGTVSVDVKVAVEGAGFSAADQLHVPGGGAALLDVGFHASNLEQAGKVSLTAVGSDTPVEVPLHAVGVRPKVCVPSAPCKQSAYSLELDTCVESDAPDDSTCTPSSICLENGRCHQGLCQGTARSCDDHNACTDDSCSEQVGCLNTPHACPIPGEPCKVATCDPGSGCGEGNAPDLSICGAVDCVNASVCFNGGCMTVSTPEGFECAPATACRDKSECHGGVCERPDASVMTPKLSIALSGVPVTSRPSLLAWSGNLYLPLCRVPVNFDGGADDGGVPNSGIGCDLHSYTSNGFERWARPLDAGAGVQLAQVGPQGALLVLPGQLQQFSLGAGDFTSFPFAPQLAGTSANAAGEPQLLSPPWLTTLQSDGGWREEQIDAGAEVLATDEYDTRWLWEPDSGVLGSLSADGGLLWRNLPPGTASLVASQGAVLAGHGALVLADGGVVLQQWLDGLGNPVELLTRHTLMGRGEAFAFFRACASGTASCTEDDKEVWARGLSLDDGGELWRGQVGAAGTFTHVEESALLDYPGAFVTLVQSVTDAGTFTYLELYADGTRADVCPFSQDLQLGGALFNGSDLWLLVDRGAGWQLERYLLGSGLLLQSGWPVADGLAGQRRAR